MLRFVLSGAVAGLLVGSTLLFGDALAPLTWSELAESRGGGANQKKCEYSCNAANGYINQCPEGTVGDPCDLCSQGSKDVTYAGDGKTGCSEKGGYVASTKRTQDCGTQERGKCVGPGVCEKVYGTIYQCVAPPATLEQGDPDDDTGAN